MSVFRPHDPSGRHPRAGALTPRALALASLIAVLGACSNEEPLDSGPDGSFGTPSSPSGNDAMDGGMRPADAGLESTVRLRFLHGLVNLDALIVCHDPDGTGPAPALPLGDATRSLRADYAGRSVSLSVAPMQSGLISLHRDLRAATDAGVDGGVASASDAGTRSDACSESTREATIPLPTPGAWFDPRSPLRDEQLRALDLATTIANAASMTLLGSGVPLDARALAARGDRARAAYLVANVGDTSGADRAAKLERDALTAAFGPRVLIQRDSPAEGGDTFTLSVFHALADVEPRSASADEEVGAIRLCVTADTRQSSAFPRAPAPGVPFRMRVPVGGVYDPDLASYTFRVFAERDLEGGKDCATASVAPLVEQKVTRASGTFRAGRSYTLAVLGALSASDLCRGGESTLVRTPCVRPVAELTPRIVLFED